MPIGNEAPPDVVGEESIRALTVANRFAWAAGIDAMKSRISIRQRTAEEGHRLWRVTYGSGDPGIRGGSFIVELNADDETVYRLLYGQ